MKRTMLNEQRDAPGGDPDDDGDSSDDGAKKNSKKFPDGHGNKVTDSNLGNKTKDLRLLIVCVILRIRVLDGRQMSIVPSGLCCSGM